MINKRFCKRLALIAGNAFLAVVLTHAGQVIWVQPAVAQSTALFIPADSLVYQGQLSGLDVQDVSSGLRLTANTTETVALVKTSSQVLSGAMVQVSVPAFAYQATLAESSSGVYRTTTSLDVAIQATADSQPLATADAKQWSIVPQSGTFTLGTVSMSQAQLPPIKLGDGLGKVSSLSQQLSAVPPVTGFIANAGITAQSTSSSYQLPVSLAMQAQLLDANNNPIANRQLTVTAAPNGLAAQTFTTTTDAKGSFTYNVTYPATVTVSGGALVNLPSSFQLSGVTADQVSAFWWGGSDSGDPGTQQTGANLGSPSDPNAAGGSDPVNIVTGNVYDTETDLAYPSVGMPVTFQRTYNSQDTSIGPFGRGWTDSYNLSMTQAQHNNVGTLTEATSNGARIVWTAQGQSGVFTPPAGAHGTLTLDQNDKTYTKTDKHGIVTHYRNGDQGGQVDSIRDANGNQMMFAYDGSRLTTITDTAGRAVRLSYDAAGRVTSLTDALGNSISYGYDATGNLASVAYPAGTKVGYSYDAAGNLVQLTDPDSHLRLFNYDSQNRAVSFSYDAGMERTTFRYDRAHNRTVLTDAAGFQTVYSYQFIGANAVINRIVDPMGGVWTSQWDADMNRVSVTDALGRTTRMAYDGNANLTRYTDASGQATNAQYETAFNWPIRVTDPLGNAQKLAYDGHGNLVSITDAAGNVTSLAVDGRGELIQVTDALGNTTKMAFDSAGNLTTGTNALGGTTLGAYDALGHPTSATDVLGRSSQLTYDGQYRLVKVTAPGSLTVALAYDASGNMTSLTDTLGRKVTVGYDQANHPVQVVDQLGRATKMAYSGRGQLSTVTDPLGETTTLTYTPAGDVAKMMRPDGGFVLQQHDAAHQLVALTDAAGHTTQYAYDSRGHLASVTDPIGGVTRYAYDALGQRTSTTDANGRRSTLTYDLERRVTAETDALNRTTAYGYDAVGNLVSVTDPLKQTTSYSFDALARLLRVSYADGQAVKFACDAAGKRTQMTDGTGTTSYGYDVLSRLVKEVLPDGTALGYSYDKAGNRTGVSTPAGATAYAYDDANQLVQVTDPAGGATNFQYDALGRVTKQSFPNGTSTAAAYDGVGQLTRLTYAGPNGVQNDVQYAYDNLGNRVIVTRNGRQTTMAMDALNRLVQVGYPGGPQLKYTYDAVGNRLSQAVSGLPEDKTGQGAREEPRDEPANGSLNYAYDAADQLLTAGSQKFAYDADGHLVSASGPQDRNTTFTWDARQLLSAVASADNKVTYGYDGYGRMVSRTQQDGGGLQNVYDGELLLLQRSTGDAAGAAAGPWTDFVGAAGQVLAAMRVNPAGKVVNKQYLQGDVQGSLIGTSNSDGKAGAGFAYTPWGSPLGHVAATQRGEGDSAPATAGDGSSDGGMYSNFAYLGQPFDSTTGLSYLNARWYMPGVGRFISVDPLAGAATQPASQNRYAYGLDNPGSQSDRTGMSVTGEPLDPGAASTPWYQMWNARHSTAVELATGWLQANQPGYSFQNEVSIPGGSSNGTGNVGYADIVGWGATDVVIYEVKAAGGPAEAAGPAQLATYQSQLQAELTARGDPRTVVLGGPIPTLGPVVNIGNPNELITDQTGQSAGMITYTWTDRGDRVPVPMPVPVVVPDNVRAQQPSWVTNRPLWSPAPAPAPAYSSIMDMLGPILVALAVTVLVLLAILAVIAFWPEILAFLAALAGWEALGGLAALFA